tara:strand:+ start:467 stop:580 length:114 start_codon:yes stop_codon:yes gene_type:complete
MYDVGTKEKRDKELRTIMREIKELDADFYKIIKRQDD